MEYGVLLWGTGGSGWGKLNTSNQALLDKMVMAPWWGEDHFWRHRHGANGLLKSSGGLMIVVFGEVFVLVGIDTLVLFLSG